MFLKRDNHFVLQLYLKSFAAASGEVLEYCILVSRSSEPVWKPVNVAGTGYEKNPYTRIVRGEEAHDFEQWLNREFESRAKALSITLLVNQKFKQSDWEIFVRFLATTRDCSDA